MKIVMADKKDADQLTDLTMRSKDHWGYGRKQIEEWREDLTITPKYIDENHVYKLTVEGRIAGFYAYQAESERVVKLNYLFIEPEDIGKGFGRALVDNFFKRIKRTEFNKVVLDADPNAEEFYLRIGFKVVGRLKSSIKDRYLPIMEMAL